MAHNGSLPCSQKSPTWTKLIQSTPSHPISLRSILILPSHLRLGLPTCLFPSGYPTQILYAFVISPMCATCPTPSILLELITLIILVEAYKLWRPSLCSLLQPHATSSLLGLNILHSHCSQTPSVCVLLLVCETKFYIHKKTTRKVIQI
jgi:hypothetical protein